MEHVSRTAAHRSHVTQGSDVAAPDASCCKGALWADVLSFTRTNYEDIDRYEPQRWL